MPVSAFAGRSARAIVPPPPSLHSPAGAQIEPQQGVAFYLRQGDILKVCDWEGAQHLDFVCFNAHDTREWLAGGRTGDGASTLCPQTGDQLYSNRQAPLVRLLSDSANRAYFSMTPAHEHTFASIVANFRERRCGFSGLLEAFALFGIEADTLPATLALFNQRGAAPSRAGDYVELHANIDLIVGLTAGAHERSASPRFKPITYEVR